MGGFNMNFQGQKCSGVMATTMCVLSLSTMGHAAVPNVRELGVDLTILSDNDLHGNTTDRTESAVLLEPSTHAQALKTCQSLNENLWMGDFEKGLDAALSYQAYLQPKDDSYATEILYWIGSDSNSTTTCTTLSTSGETSTDTPCNTTLPSLCTHSAPMPIAAHPDTSPQYQITQTLGSKTSITGFRNFHTFEFHGLRFANPPERFTFSSLYNTDEQDEVNGLEFGASCMQPPAPFPRYLGNISEDCLYLNIWTPYLPADTDAAVENGKLKPVMLWLHGGGNVEGTGRDPEKEGQALASRGDVVVISMNYRLGNLGWLAFNDGVHNGNYGLSDIFTALKWTEKYISAFGGDPEQITVFGCSAGGTDLRAVLASEWSDGLVKGAIMQSVMDGPMDKGGWSNYSRPERWYRDVTRGVLEESGCANATDEVECMKGQDAAEWEKEGRKKAAVPTRDGTIITYAGLPVAGPLAKPRDINIAIGYVRNEAAMWMPTELPVNFTEHVKWLTEFSEINLMHLVDDLLFNPELSPEFPSLSPEQKKQVLNLELQRIGSEAIFKCLSSALVYSAKKNGVFKSVYHLEFNRTYVPSLKWPVDGQIACGRFIEDPDIEEYPKCHSADIPVVFGNFGFLSWPNRAGTDVPYNRLAVDYWTSFARTGRMDPETAYLEARKYQSTIEQLGRTGSWLEVGNEEGKDVMSLQWLGQSMMEWSEEQAARCKALTYPRDIYESVDFEA